MKIQAYYSWAQSAVTNNAAAYLPHVTKDQKRRIQVGMNNALRAAVNAPYKIRNSSGIFRYLSATKLRKKYKVPSVEQLRRLCIVKCAWNRRNELHEEERTHAEGLRVTTRNMPLIRWKITRGIESLSIDSLCRRMWAEIPERIKIENNPKRAKRLMKDWIFDRGRAPNRV